MDPKTIELRDPTRKKLVFRFLLNGMAISLILTVICWLILLTAHLNTRFVVTAGTFLFSQYLIWRVLLKMVDYSYSFTIDRETGVITLKNEIPLFGGKFRDKVHQKGTVKEVAFREYSKRGKTYYALELKFLNGKSYFMLTWEEITDELQKTLVEINNCLER